MAGDNTYFIRLSSGSPVVTARGGSKHDAYVRFLIERTNNAKHGLVQVALPYSNPIVAILDVNRLAWPPDYHGLDFIHDEEEHDTWEESTA